MCFKTSRLFESEMVLNVVVIALVVGLTLGAEEKEVKYQLATKKVTIADKPTNTSTIKSETLQLITIANSASYGVQNPDFGIISVTIKSYYKDSGGEKNGH